MRSLFRREMSMKLGLRVMNCNILHGEIAVFIKERGSGVLCNIMLSNIFRGVWLHVWSIVKDQRKLENSFT